MRAKVDYSKPGGIGAAVSSPVADRYRVQRRRSDTGPSVFDVVEIATGTVLFRHSQERHARTWMGQRVTQQVKAAQKKERPCMCCRTPFPSEGIHNRLCEVCRKKSGELI